MTFRLCPFIEYYVRNIFRERSCRKCAPKASPRPFLNFGKQPKQSLHARNYFKNKIF